jgi:hypothetical protein
MPDVDKIKAKIPRRYKKAYAQICEGYFSDAALAYETLKPLKNDVEDYGKSPLLFLQEVTEHLNNLRSLPLFTSTINWSDEKKQINEIKGEYLRKYRPNIESMDLALKACGKLIHKIRNNENIEANAHRELLNLYIQNIYESRFADRLPLTEDHYQEINVNELLFRLEELKPYMDNGIEYFSSQLERNVQLKRLRLPPRSNKRQTTDLLDEDIFNLD